MLHLKTLSILCLIMSTQFCTADVVSYTFDIDYKEIKITDKSVLAMSINNQIPAPTIEAKVGDILSVTFNNLMDVETSVHWHGVLLPNEQDGVPYLTTSPIKAGATYTYQFPVTHSGTYWYHSHTGIQEQRGLYGSLVFHAKDDSYKYDEERVIVLSDWTNENPKDVLRNLKRDGDYYSLKKDTVQSWDKLIQNSFPALKNRFNNARIRMGSMDISDVGYDAFLINGEKQAFDKSIKAGSKVRLRIINGSASSYFYVDFAGGGMTIIEADGVAVVPVVVDRLRLAVAETYDVIISMPDEENSYELRATSEDATGYASLYLGQGGIISTNSVEKPNLFLMNHSMHMMPMQEGNNDMHHGHQNMNHQNESNLRMLNEYDGLRSPGDTSLDPDNPSREIKLSLTGSMERYVWSFNNKTLSESDRILVRKGENVRFILKNETMMHHPIHLHGHFFRVINGQGKHSPLKHTVNVPPFEEVIIEFYANEEKDWFFHCHNLYHMKNGMARVVRYENNKPDNDLNAAFYQQLKTNGDPWYGFADTSFHSNMMAGEFWSMNTRNSIRLHYDFDYENEYDVDLFYIRHLTRFFGIYAGVNVEREDSETDSAVITGINYTLPFLIESDIRLDSDGAFRVQLQSDYQLTKRIKFDWLWNSDDEYRFQMAYDVNKRLSVVINHDSDFDFGAGIEIHF